jgi:hypothetical protein
MPATKLTTILIRTSQSLTAAALMTGLAFGAAPIANAKWDQAVYDRCLSSYTGVADHTDWWAFVASCCLDAGGAHIKDKDGNFAGCNRNPPAQGPGATPTGKPGATPQPEQGGELGPGAPVTPVPVGPRPARG